MVDGLRSCAVPGGDAELQNALIIALVQVRIGPLCPPTEPTSLCYLTRVLSLRGNAFAHDPAFLPPAATTPTGELHARLRSADRPGPGG